MILLNVLRYVERFVIVTIFFVMVAMFFLNVLAREFGGSLASDLAWVEEAVRLLNIFLVFGALGLALERGRHVGIDTFRNSLSAKVRAVLLKFIDLVGFVFSVYLAYLGWGLVKFVLITGQRSPTLDLPMGWIYVAPVVGFILMAIRFALSFLGVINRFSGETLPSGEAK